MKINAVTNHSQNKQQNPAFKAKMTLTVLEPGKELTKEAIERLGMAGIFKFGSVISNSHQIEGLNAVVFDFPRASIEQLKGFFKDIPDTIRAVFEA